MFLQNGRIIDRRYLSGVRIQISPDIFQTIDNVEAVASLRAFERNVFAEVSNALFILAFIARPRIDFVAAIDHWRRGGQMNYPQSVI